MCHPLSCCHPAGSVSPLALPLHQLVRLLLASDAPEPELLPYQQPRLHARLDACWARLHATVQRLHGVSAGRAQQVGEQLLVALLREACCRQAVRQRVPLAQALGAAATQGCRLRWAARGRALKQQKRGWHTA
ncbi:MAG: hypothetical protein ACRYFZ_15975 [Janthinobacterium lividum]